MPAAAPKRSIAPLKDLYDIGEIPPLGHVPEKMHAWVIRKERHGPPDQAMQLEVVPTWPIAEDEVLVLVMAGGVNYNGVWAGLGQPISTLDVHKHPFHIAGSDAAGIVWAIGSKVHPDCRSATKSSCTAIRMTATMRTAMAATRCCRRRSESGATRRRTVRSRNSAACSRAS